MGRYSCIVCDNKAARTAINEELAKGLSAAYIAEVMTLRGFPITAPTINGHKKHDPTAVAGLAKTRRDFAIMVRDRAVEMFEADPDNPDATPALDLANKDHVPGIVAGLKAQAEINKQVSKSDDRKTAIAMAMILSGANTGRPPAHLLVSDGKTIEGEFEEVDPVEEADPD